MNTTTATRMNRFAVTAGTACALLVAAGAADLSVAGIQGSGKASMLSVGRITAFGSIFVGGVEYRTTSASIRVDDSPASEAQLRIGQVVTVKGTVNPGNLDGVATEVSFSADVHGVVTSVDLANNTFVALGQTVRVTPETLFDERIQSESLAGLRTGASVQVSGFADAEGELVASRVDLPESAALRVKGVVSNLSESAHTFRINSLTVDYSGALPARSLSNGSTVTVSGASADGALLVATKVTESNGAGGAANEQGQIEGLVTALNSSADFMIGPQRVVATSDTKWQLQGQTLGLDVEVSVSGVFDEAGVLVASRIKAKPSAAAKSGASTSAAVKAAK